MVLSSCIVVFFFFWTTIIGNWSLASSKCILCGEPDNKIYWLRWSSFPCAQTFCRWINTRFHHQGNMEWLWFSCLLNYYEESRYVVGLLRYNHGILFTNSNSSFGVSLWEIGECRLFRAYYIRLKLKKHIILFNLLLEHQYHLTKYPMPPKLHVAPIHSGIHPMTGNL